MIWEKELNVMNMKGRIRQIGLMILCCAFILCSCQSREISAVSAPKATGSLYVSILDIGKADAIILRTENHTVVIDCGEKGDGKDVLNCLSENNVDSIDYLFITHFDKDHVGGAAKVINGISVGEIITPDYEGTNDEYEQFLDAALENNITPAALTENMTFTLDDALFEVFPPMKTSYQEEDNDFSLVISVTHGENTFLFAGDAEKERLSELSKQLDLRHTFLKVPHHGNYNAMTKSFLTSVNPKYAVITCSEKNPASDEVLNILDSLGCEVFQTVSADVYAVSDGQTITVSQ